MRADLISIIDITSRRESDERSRFLSSIVEQSGESILCTDTEFHINYVNRSAEELFGWRFEELNGKTPGILNVEPNAKEMQTEIYTTVSLGKVYDGEALNIRKNGESFWCQFKVSPLTDENGNICGYMGSQRDITKMKIAEAGLRDSREQLRSLSAHLQSAREQERTLIAREIHDELGQALTGIKMDAFWLKRRLPKENDTLIAKADSMIGLLDESI
ncbi:PAS domain S-box protein [Thermodesulfobacteriota bacterium]